MTVYHAYWDSYLKGDMETMASFIADEFQVIGTTESEVFLDKQETLQFYEATADQISGKMEFRNRNIRQKLNNGMITVSEFSDAYILTDDKWVFYAKFRITSLLENKENGWKFVQQHGSIPDARAQEGEQLASEKIRQENLELREAVKRRTVELENKNRELEIEASLERVRAIALSMKKPTDMLEVCRVISNQLTQFNVKNIRNVQTVIINESKRTYLNYQYFTAYDRFVTEETDPAKNPTVLEMVHAMQKSADSFFSGSLEGHKLDEFRKYRKEDNQFPDPILEKTDAIFYYFYSIGQGGLGVTTYKPLPSEGLNIFKRFHNVFALAYRRFLDIEKAEAQAREAQIEASLERVRSLALGMHRSEEVGRVSDGFFAEFNKLTVKILGCSIVVVDEEKDSMELWRARSDVALKPFDKHSFSSAMTTVKNNLPDFFPVFYKTLKEKKDNLMYELSGDERLSFLNTIIEQSKYSDKDKAKLFKSIPDHIVTYYIYFKLGYLALITEKKLPDENLVFARRFIDVFSFAYTRYLDIQRAEAQAREAQIETALERVRAKAMAMHNSDDLAQTVDVFFKELRSLDVTPRRCGVTLIDEDTHIADLTVTTAKGKNKDLKMTGKLTLAGHPVLENVYNYWKRQKEFHPVLKGQEIKEYYNAMNFEIEYPDSTNDEIQYGHYFYFKEGGVFAWTDKELPESSLNIFRKFTSVLSLTYRRYLDLIEAEAQAREAQIEAALERVRARTLAMQNSEELAETASLLFKQFEELVGLPDYSRTFISIIDKKSETAKVWMTLPDGKVRPGNHRVPLTRNYTLQRVFNSWKKNEPVIIRDLSGTELADYFQFLSSLPHVQSDESLKKQIKSRPERLVFSEASFAFGLIGVMTGSPLDESTRNILVRFAKVFEQTYTRFLDLENAEQQNKIIQAENERKTKELEEARLMQLSMLPKELPKLPHLDIAVYMQTATEVGGDYYDFVMHENGSLNICLGDATGHGMKAGIMVSSMKSIFTTNAPKMDIASFFETANSGVKSMGLKRMMMGFIMLNIQGKAVQFINGGMPPLFLFRKNPATVEELKEHGLPIGAMNISQYNETSISLDRGDVLLLLTDGMPELHNQRNEMYGYERLYALFEKTAKKSANEIITCLKNDASDWVHDAAPDDDVTFVVIKVK